MRTRACYLGHTTGLKNSQFWFVVNGKGERGNGELWDGTDWAIALSLSRYIEENTRSYGPIFYGDNLIFIYDNRDSITGWKNSVANAYREWKKLQH